MDIKDKIDQVKEAAVDGALVALDAAKDGTVIALDAAKDGTVVALDAAKDGGQFVLAHAADAGIAIADAAHHGGQRALGFLADQKDKLAEFKLQMLLNQLNPIYDYQELESYPKILYLTTKNLHEDIEQCEDAIAYDREIANTKVLELPRRNLKLFGITLYPHKHGQIYLQNPYVPTEYIATQQYFDYIKDQKLIELEDVAFSLGAKKVLIESIEEEKKHAKVKAGVKATAKADKNAKMTADQHIKAEARKTENKTVLFEDVFEGHDPERPDLVYLKYDNAILNLINQRMKGGVLKQTHKIEHSTTMDLSIDTAKSVDAVAKNLAINIGPAIEIEAEKDTRTYFQYHFEF